MIALTIAACPALVLGDNPPPPPDRPHDGPPPPRGAGEDRRERRPGDAPPDSPEEMRERIERRLEMVRGEESRLQRALEQLNAGMPPEEVFENLREGPGDRRERGMGGRNRGPDGGPPGGPDGDVPEEFRPDMAPRVMKFLEDRDPETFDRLREARERNPERFDSMVRERWPKIREKMLKTDKDLKKMGADLEALRALDRQAYDLANRAAAAEGDERTRLMGELRTAVENQFNLIAETRRAEIKRLEDRVAGLTETLNDTEQNRALMVDDRIAKLMDDVAHRSAPERTPDRPAEPPSH